MGRRWYYWCLGPWTSGASEEWFKIIQISYILFILIYSTPKTLICQCSKICISVPDISVDLSISNRKNKNIGDNDIKYFHRASNVLQFTQGASHMPINLILMATLWGGYYYFSHLINEETETRASKSLTPGYTGQRNQDLNQTVWFQTLWYLRLCYIFSRLFIHHLIAINTN